MTHSFWSMCYSLKTTTAKHSFKAIIYLNHKNKCFNGKWVGPERIQEHLDFILLCLMVEVRRKLLWKFLRTILIGFLRSFPHNLYKRKILSMLMKWRKEFKVIWLRLLKTPSQIYKINTIDLKNLRDLLMHKVSSTKKKMRTFSR